MARNIEDWIKDAEAYEILKSYAVEEDVDFDFLGNEQQEDFYMSLLNKFIKIITKEGVLDDSDKKELLQLAKGLVLYSHPKTSKYLHGVNPESNKLYVSTIYYLCDYKAISSLISGSIGEINAMVEAARVLYFLLSGNQNIDQTHGNLLTENLLRYIRTGDETSLISIQNQLKLKDENFNYSSIDDYFYSCILDVVLRKFKEDNLWQTLKPYNSNGFWDYYIRYSCNKRILSLLPSQVTAINKGLLCFDRSFSLHMPTSAGKTYITEMLVYQELRSNPSAKILYLAPLRSLSRELRVRYARISREWRFKFKAAYGGSTTSVDEGDLDEAQLIIATPETFTTLEESNEGLVGSLTLVICDEGQLLNEIGRGVNYELLLTRMKQQKGLRFLFISAIIPNIKEINTWLGGHITDVGDSKYRPCKIRLALAQRLDEKNRLLCLNDDFTKWSVRVDHFLSKEQIKILGEQQRPYSCALALKASEGGPVMLYCSFKDGGRGCLAHAKDMLNLINTGVFNTHLECVENRMPGYIEGVVDYFSYHLGQDYQLTEYLRHGFAYHHGQLPQDLRELIEDAFSKRQIQLICCTNTLAEGVNMPVKTIVLANITDTDGNDFTKLLDQKALKNILGRAGRAGKENFGMVLLPVKRTNERALSSVRDALLDNNIGNIHGTLYETVQQILRLGEIDDDTLDAELIKVQGSDAIDKMIMLKSSDDYMRDVNIEEVIHDSLAYYLGAQDVKQCLERIFNVRYQRLKQRFQMGGAHKYKQTGLAVSEYDELSNLIRKDDISSVMITDEITSDIVSYLVDVIFELPSVIKFINELSSKKPLKAIMTNKEIVKKLLLVWIKGLRYVEMAQEVGVTVEQAVLFADYIQQRLVYKIQAIVLYTKAEIGIDNPLLNQVVGFAKYGVCSALSLMLVDKGLNDRSVVVKLADYINIHYASIQNQELLFRRLIDDGAISDYLKVSGLPSISLNRWDKFHRHYCQI